MRSCSHGFFRPDTGGCMKICQVVLVLTLGTGAGAVLTAPSLPAGKPAPADTVMVASETMPGGVELFPEFLASSHPALLRGLPIDPAVRPSPSRSSSIAPRSRTRTADRYGPADPVLERILCLPGSIRGGFGRRTGGSAAAYAGQVGRRRNGYTRRFASEYGQLATRNVIHDGLAGITGLDPRYVVCKCRRQAAAQCPRPENELHDLSGRRTVDARRTEIAGAYGSGMISTYWYPHNQFSPLVQGVRFGHEQMGEMLVGNLMHEFGPDLQRHLHLHALTARRHPLPRRRRLGSDIFLTWKTVARQPAIHIHAYSKSALMTGTVLCLRVVNGRAACPCSSALESAPKAEQRRSPMRSGRWLFATVCLFLFLAAAGTAEAQNPFVGTWKLNQEKSQLAGDIMSWPSGQRRDRADRRGNHLFLPRGRQTLRVPSGNVAIWRETGPDTWTTEYRKTDGKLMSSDNWKLSTDGRTPPSPPAA